MQILKRDRENESQIRQREQKLNTRNNCKINITADAKTTDSQ